MRRLVQFFILSIFLVQIAAAQTAAQTVFTIEIHENGNAVWTGEKRYPLTASDITVWDAAIKRGENLTKYQKDIKDELERSLRAAQKSTNRSMEIEKLNISYETIKTVSGGFGIVRYSFGWKNFSRTEPGKIIMGDAFSEGNVLPSDITFIVKIPPEYDVQSASPDFDRRDGNRLIWDGTMHRTFGKGEPSLALSRTVISRNTWPMVLVAVVVFIAGAILVLWKRRRLPIDIPMYGRNDDTVSTYNTAAEAAQTENTRSETSSAPPFDLSAEFLGDEEMIEQYLMKCGGQAYQSDIVEHSGLSKSKISIVLAKMKENGKILKIKKGKENIIRMASRK